MDEKTLLIRLGLSVLFGLLIGFERERNNKDAGATTHALVALAAALLVIISKEGFNHGMDDAMRAADSARVAASIIPGIGFLGAGAIIVRGDRISGLTTAAGILVTAAIGMGFGSGLYLVSCTSALLVFFVLAFTRLLDKIRHRIPPQVEIRAQSARTDSRQYDHEQDTDTL